MHLQMARDFKADIEKLAKEIGDKIAEVEKIVAARKATSQQPQYSSDPEQGAGAGR
jgi:hypothetical protein